MSATPMMPRPTRAAFHLAHEFKFVFVCYFLYWFLGKKVKKLKRRKIFGPPAHLVTQGSEQVCADQVGDGCWQEGGSQLPLDGGVV